MPKITYIDDLAKELQKDFGLSEKEALEICKLNVDHVYDLIRDPNIISISFPMLGTLHLNMRIGKYSRVFREFKELVAAQVALIEEQLSERKDLVHGRRSYYSIIRKYFYPDSKVRRYVRREEVYKKMELKQNKK